MLYKIVRFYIVGGERREEETEGAGTEGEGGARLGHCSVSLSAGGRSFGESLTKSSQT